MTVALAAWPGTLWAGQEPYIAVVGQDTHLDWFYVSEKLEQFLNRNTDHAAYCGKPAYGNFNYTYIRCPSGKKPVEYFKVNDQPWHNYHSRQPEVCDGHGDHYGNENALVPAGSGGWFEWRVVLPMKPVSNINLTLQCGILKPDAYTVFGYNSIWVCAGETGERVGHGLCTRKFAKDGTNPIDPNAEPTLTASVTAGAYSQQAKGTTRPLTAFRVPSVFTLTSDGATVLDGSPAARMHMKACMSETVIVKMPVRGHDIDGDGPGLDTEFDLTQGDFVTVRLTLPAGHTMDMYCHYQSLQVQGMGEPETLLD